MSGRYEQFRERAEFVEPDLIDRGNSEATGASGS